MNAALRARIAFALARARAVHLARSDDEQVDDLIKRGGEALAALVALLAAGRITKAQFIERANKELADATQQAGTLGGGDAVDADSIDSLLSDRADYLDGYAGDIESGTVSVAQAAARATMWAGLAWTAYQMGRGDKAQADGLTSATWKLDPGAQHCDDCIALAEGSPYPIDELPTEPGAGDTACQSNCRCEWVFSDEES